MTASYRTATPADAEAIDRVFRTSFCETFAHLYRPEDLAAFLEQFTLGAWRSELTDPTYVLRVAEVDGQVVGYVKLGPLNLPIETSVAAVLLSQLYVLKQHHGVGIARALMDWALADSRRRGFAEMYLTVFIDNHRARSLYQRYGFEVVGHYDFMVGSQADEDVIMRRAL